ncbi:MAG TPA: hypothetical protein VKG90_10455, partial [Marmoricola sp.]|nr:hypothetical protein [Marmoricola sp.]
MTHHTSDSALPGSAQPLLDAVIAISSDLDLTSVLTRIVVSASELTGARFGALGVIGGDGELSDFITT